MLRSGQPVTGIWRSINRQGAGQHFHKGEIIAGRDAVETRRPRILFGGSGNSSSADDLYTINAVNQSTLTAIGPGNSSVTIYKTLELQGGLTGESIDGVNYSYANYTDNYNERTATDPNSNTYNQYISPRYAVGQIITAHTINGRTGLTFPGGTSYPNSGTFLLETSPSRQWGGVP